MPFPEFCLLSNTGPHQQEAGAKSTQWSVAASWILILKILIISIARQIDKNAVLIDISKTTEGDSMQSHNDGRCVVLSLQWYT